MKKIIITSLVCLSSVFSFGQSIKFDDVQSGTIEKGTYESYTTKDGGLYKIGDKVQFGNPSGTNGKFVTIQKVDIMGTVYPVGSEIMNTSAEIKKIRVSGSKRAGLKVQFQTKGYSGIDNYFLMIEDAIQSGEVQSSGMSSDKALNELKKAKDKLDLGLINQQEFDKLKSDLSKYIK